MSIPFQGKLIVLVAAAGCFGLSWILTTSHEETKANRPKDEIVPLWVTPQATIVPSLSASVDKHNLIVVSLEQFKRDAGNRPYQIFIWEGWMSGVRLDTWNMPTRSVTYQSKMKKGDFEGNFIAYGYVPLWTFASDTWGMRTSFYPARNEFVLAATKTPPNESKEGNFFWYLAIFIIGGVIIKFLWDLAPRAHPA